MNRTPITFVAAFAAALLPWPVVAADDLIDSPAKYKGGADLLIKWSGPADQLFLGATPEAVTGPAGLRLLYVVAIKLRPGKSGKALSPK